MLNLIRPVVVLFVMLSVMTGLVYPLIVTASGQWLFPKQTAGSLLFDQDKPAGSALISQSFQDPKYFWGRLSATTPMPNNAAASSGSNLGPSNPALLDAVKARITALREADPSNTAPVPVDLVTASGSGLDPEISPAAAFYQVSRVAAARHIDAESLRKQVQEAIEAPQWMMFGEPRVNVLMLNRALDTHP